MLLPLAKSVLHCRLQGGPTKGCVGTTQDPALDHTMGEHNLIGLNPRFSELD